jgi:hypothetical protein
MSIIFFSFFSLCWYEAGLSVRNSIAVENIVLRKPFETGEEDMAGSWLKFHNEKSHKRHFSLYILR